LIEDETISALIDRRVRELLTEMGDRPPREREALAGAVEKLLRAKPLASERGLDLLTMLRDLERGPKPLEENEDE
jgi:hypothetical protein